MTAISADERQKLTGYIRNFLAKNFDDLIITLEAGGMDFSPSAMLDITLSADEYIKQITDKIITLQKLDREYFEVETQGF